MPRSCPPPVPAPADAGRRARRLRPSGRRRDRTALVRNTRTGRRGGAAVDRHELPAHPHVRDRLHARGHPVAQPRRPHEPRGARLVRHGPTAVQGRDQPAEDGRAAGVAFDALDDAAHAGALEPGRRAAAAPRLARPRQGAALHPGRHPRERVRGRGREHAHDRAPGHDAVRHRSRGGRDPRRRRRHLQRDPEPGRPRRGHARERQRLRPQPRLPDAVAVGDEGVGPDHAGVAPAGDARPARLRHADADRGDDEAAQPGDRLRPLAEVEPVAHRRERGGDERRQHGRHSPGQRLVLRRQRLRSGRDLPGRPAGRAGGRRELGRLGPLLHADVLAARRPERLDGRDVQQHEYGDRPAQPLLPQRRPRPGQEPDRSERVAACAADGELVDAAVRHGEPKRSPQRPARDLPARRRRRGAASVLPGAVRPREQLDARVPERVRDPARGGPAQRRRGEPPRRLAALQRHRGAPDSASTRPSSARTSRRARTSSTWRRPTGVSPRRRSGSASTSPAGSASSTRRPRRGATATSGAPTRCRCRTACRSRRRRRSRSRSPSSSAAVSRAARPTTTRSRSTRRPRCGR